MSTDLSSIRVAATEHILDAKNKGRGGHWLPVLAIALGVFAFVTTEFIPVGLIPQIAHDLGVSLGGAGLMLTVPGLTSAFAAPVLIVAAGSIDRRRVILVLTGLLVASNAVSAIAPNFAVLMVGRLLLGLCLGGFWSVALSAGGRVVPASRQTQAVSIIMSGMTFATVMGIPLGSYIGALYGWRASFAATGTIAAIGFVALSVALVPLPAHAVVRAADLRRLLGTRRVQAALLVVASLFASNIASYTYIAPYLLRLTPFGPNAVPPVLFAFGGLGFIANLLIAPAVAARPKGVLLSMACMMGAAMVALLLFRESAIGVTAALFLWSIPFGAAPLCLNAWLQHSAPEDPEAIAGLFISSVQLSIAAGSAVAAAAVARFAVPSNLWLGAALALVGLVLVARSIAQPR